MVAIPSVLPAPLGGRGRKVRPKGGLLSTRPGSWDKAPDVGPWGNVEKFYIVGGGRSVMSYRKGATRRKWRVSGVFI